MECDAISVECDVWSLECDVVLGSCLVQAFEYRVVLGSSLWKCCGIKQYLKVLCASFVVQSSTARCSSCVKQECPTRLPSEICQARVCQEEFQARLFYKSVLHEYSAKVSRKSVQQECLTRVLQNIERERQASMSSKSVQKIVLSECVAQSKSVRPEFLTSPIRESHKSAQECPTRLSEKSVKQECSARAACTAIKHLLFAFLWSPFFYGNLKNAFWFVASASISLFSSTVKKIILGGPGKAILDAEECIIVC